MKKLISLILFSAIVLFVAVSCGDDDEGPTATISINAVGSDLGGDVTGSGGSKTQAFTWTNSSTTAEYNMDITAAAGGSFTLAIADANGIVVANQTLIKGQGDDSRSGVSSAGVAGDWTITVTLTNFSGDGSFSINAGD